MPALVSDIVSAVINELSQVPGIATQIYSSGRILQHIQDAFLLEIEEMWWPDYMAFIGPIPLDGETGRLTQDLVGPLATITEYRDIASVFMSNTNRKLRQFPQSMNPTAVLSGSRGMYMMPDYTVPARPFRVVPFDSTYPVVAWCRQRPKLPLANNSTLYLDQLLLQYDALWMYAVDDGTIPAQVNKFQVLAQNRRRMIKAAFSVQPLELDPRWAADDPLMDGIDDTFLTVGIHPIP
jgi:hypothetical protein